MGRALYHFDQTVQAIASDYYQKSQTARGQGQIVGDVLQTFLTGGALKSAKEAGTVGKITAKLQDVGSDLSRLRVTVDRGTLSSGPLPLGGVKVSVTPSTTLIEQPRDVLGRFAPKVGGEVRPGFAAEQSALDAIRAKPGYRVTPGPVYVRDSTGQVRVYDGVATSPNNRSVGIEVKSGSAKLTLQQRAFDSRLNSSRFNTATGIGQNDDLIINRAIEVRR